MKINFMWLADKILQARDARTEVKVLVHEAFITNGPTQTPQYFIKVINNSPTTPFTITHVWVKDGSKEIDIVNPNRTLPYKLEKTEVWETWFAKNKIENHDNVFNNVRVVLSNGKEYRSKKNKKVRPAGSIAGQ